MQALCVAFVAMNSLSANLTAKRAKLGLSVVQVHQALNRKGIEVAFSTVAGWFNGSRGVRNMKHLKALCDVLQTSLDEIANDGVKVVSEEPKTIAIVRELDGLSDLQKEAVLAIVRAMKDSRS